MATAIDPKRLPTKQVRRVSPSPLDSIAPGFVMIGLVQQSMTLPRRRQPVHSTQQTDYLNNGGLYAPRYEKPCMPTGRKRFCYNPCVHAWKKDRTSDLAVLKRPIAVDATCVVCRGPSPLSYW